MTDDEIEIMEAVEEIQSCFSRNLKTMIDKHGKELVWIAIMNFIYPYDSNEEPVVY